MSYASTLAPSLRPADLATLVEELAAHPARWQAEVRFCADERWWTRLYGDDVVDVWLLTWVTDSATDLHDHGASSGAFVVVAGVLEEIRPDRPSGSPTVTRLHPGEFREIPDGTVHEVRNPSRLPAISIHAYSPPLQEMTYYAADESGPRPTRTVTTTHEALSA